MRPSKRGRAQASIPSSRMAGSLEARLPCVNICYVWARAADGCSNDERDKAFQDAVLFGVVCEPGRWSSRHQPKPCSTVAGPGIRG